jgi:chromosome segregation ATPase
MEQTVEELFGCIATQFGIATGAAIKSEIDALLGLPNVNITALQAAVTQIQALLDADPNTEGFQVGQNIITQLVSLGDRITALENDTVVATLQTMVNSLAVDLAAEVNRAQAAEQALQDLIDGLQTQVTTLQTALDNLPAGNGCDCAALQAQITALQTTITNLQAADAQTAVQIAALQTSIGDLSAQITAAATAAAVAQATASAAASAAAAAQATADANATAIAALDAREHSNHNNHGGQIAGLQAFKTAFLNQSCTNLRGMFEAGITLGKAGGY